MRWCSRRCRSGTVSSVPCVRPALGFRSREFLGTQLIVRDSGQAVHGQVDERPGASRCAPGFRSRRTRRVIGHMIGEERNSRPDRIWRAAATAVSCPMACPASTASVSSSSSLVHSAGTTCCSTIPSPTSRTRAANFPVPGCERHCNGGPPARPECRGAIARQIIRRRTDDQLQGEQPRAMTPSAATCRPETDIDAIFDPVADAIVQFDVRLHLGIEPAELIQHRPEHRREDDPGRRCATARRSPPWRARHLEGALQAGKRGLPVSRNWRPHR